MYELNSINILQLTIDSIQPATDKQYVGMFTHYLAVTFLSVDSDPTDARVP